MKTFDSLDLALSGLKGSINGIALQHQPIFLSHSFAELQSQKAELEKKYVHVLQILESEKTAKWQLLQHCEEQGQLVTSLKAEVY